MTDSQSERTTMSHLLFLCTGNYYRSRFAEFYFRHLVKEHQAPWTVDSRGLEPDPYNPGPMANSTRKLCQEMGISTAPDRFPIKLTIEELNKASLVVAVKETEHKPMMLRQFPAWANHIEYWEIHDLDVETPTEMFPQLIREVDQLFHRLTGCSRFCK